MTLLREDFHVPETVGLVERRRTQDELLAGQKIIELQDLWRLLR